MLANPPGGSRASRSCHALYRYREGLHLPADADAGGARFGAEPDPQRGCGPGGVGGRPGLRRRSPCGRTGAAGDVDALRVLAVVDDEARRAADGWGVARRRRFCDPLLDVGTHPELCGLVHGLGRSEVPGTSGDRIGQGLEVTERTPRRVRETRAADPIFRAKAHRFLPCRCAARSRGLAAHGPDSGFQGFGARDGRRVPGDFGSCGRTPGLAKNGDLTAPCSDRGFGRSGCRLGLRTLRTGVAPSGTSVRRPAHGLARPRGSAAMEVNSGAGVVGCGMDSQPSHDGPPIELVEGGLYVKEWDTMPGNRTDRARIGKFGESPDGYRVGRQRTAGRVEAEAQPTLRRRLDRPTVTRKISLVEKRE